MGATKTRIPTTRTASPQTSYDVLHAAGMVIADTTHRATAKKWRAAGYTVTDILLPNCPPRWTAEMPVSALSVVASN